MKNTWIYMIIMIFILSYTSTVYASKNESDYSIEKIFEQQINQLQLEKLQNAASKALQGGDNKELSIHQLLQQVVTGKIKMNLSDLINYIFKELFKELFTNMKYLFEILLISIFCALLKNLSDSFTSKSVASVGFYACYIVLTILLVRTFTFTIEIAKNAIFDMKLFVDALVPVLITLMVSTGNVMTASFFQPIILLSVEVVNTFILSIIIPVIYLMMVLQVVNYLAEKEMLSKLAELIQAGIKWSLVTIISLFFTIVTLHGLTAPVIDGIGAKTAKFAVGNFIPIVGGIMADSVDLIFNCSLVIKNGIGVVGVIILGAICIIPLMKILAMMLLYKLGAALIQPIVEENIVECISQIGTICTMLFAAVVTISLMFIISITAMVGAGNLTSMLR